MYVDDLLIFSENMNFIKTIKKHLKKRFKTTNLKSVFHDLEFSIKRKFDQIILN